MGGIEAWIEIVTPQQLSISSAPNWYEIRFESIVQKKKSLFFFLLWLDRR